MAGIMRIIFIIGRTWRVASLVSVFYLICFIPQYGFCEASDSSNSRQMAQQVLNSVAMDDEALLVKNFDFLEKSIQDSSDPLEEGRKFLNAFVNEVNSAYGLHLTIQDACISVRQNLPTLDLDPEIKKTILATIELFEVSPNQPDNSMPSSSEKQSDNFLGMINNLPQHSLSIYWPWEWNWFGLNKKSRKPHHPSPSFAPYIAQVAPPGREKELPANCYLGGCEMLAGALIFILPLPGAQWLGGVMVGDGVRRVVDGVVQFGEERRMDPNYETPPGFGVNF